MVARLTGDPRRRPARLPRPAGRHRRPTSPWRSPTTSTTTRPAASGGSTCARLSTRPPGCSGMLTGGAITALSSDATVRARVARRVGGGAARGARRDRGAAGGHRQGLGRPADHLIGQIAAAMRDQALAGRILDPVTPDDHGERARLVRRMERLVLNDRAEDEQTELRHTRFNPLKPFDLVRPLVLRARRGRHRRGRPCRTASAAARVGFHRQGSGADGAGGAGVRYGDGAARRARTRRHDRYDDPAREAADLPLDRRVRGHLADQRPRRHPQQRGRHERPRPVRRASSSLPGGHALARPGDRRPRSRAPTSPTASTSTSTATTSRPTSGRHDRGVGRLRPQRHPDAATASSRSSSTTSRRCTARCTGRPRTSPRSCRSPTGPSRCTTGCRTGCAQLARAHRGRAAAESGTGIDLHAVRRRDRRRTSPRSSGSAAAAATGKFLERVAGEEQHHSSWLFGDPVTPILRAYAGDPARVQLVHAGIKETHVFHLHVHQWHAVWTDSAAPSSWDPDAPRGSQLIDSITIGPQHGFTIDPLYGSGSRQHAPGDIIWHCHLYPHFHHGMWGLWRSFDRKVAEASLFPDGIDLPPAGAAARAATAGPGRPAAPGLPLVHRRPYPQKAPPPPAPQRGRVRRPAPAARDAAALSPPRRPRWCRRSAGVPGRCSSTSTARPRTWNDRAELPAAAAGSTSTSRCSASDITYNGRGWHDPFGHRYRVTGIRSSTASTRRRPVSTDADVAARPVTARAAVRPRANHGDVVELTLHQPLDTLPRRPLRPRSAAGRVRAARAPGQVRRARRRRLVHRLELPVRRELPRGGRPACPAGAAVGRSPASTAGSSTRSSARASSTTTCWRTTGRSAACSPRWSPSRPARGGAPSRSDQSGHRVDGRPGRDRARRAAAPQFEPFREACLAVGDFIPHYEPARDPRQPAARAGARRRSGRRPSTPPGELQRRRRPRRDGRQLPQRPARPSAATTRRAGSPAGDPDTGVIRTHPGDRLRIRLIQGSHEEQHSFVTARAELAPGVAEPGRRRWSASRPSASPRRSPSTSAARGGMPYGLGDHLWRFSTHGRPVAGLLGDRPGRTAERAGTHLPPPAGARRSPPCSAGPPAQAGVREFVVAGAAGRAPLRRRPAHRPVGPGVRAWCRPTSSMRSSPAPRRRRGRSARTARTRTRSPSCCAASPGEWVHVTLVNEVLLRGRPDAGRRGVDAVLGRPTASPSRTSRRSAPSQPAACVPLDEDDARGVAARVAAPVAAALRRRRPRRRPRRPQPRQHRVRAAGPARRRARRPAPGAGPRPGRGGEETGEATGGVEADPDGDPLVATADRTNVREYWWYADPLLLQGSPHGPVCYLHDMADIRNHRHHGLVGALVSSRRGRTLQDADGHAGADRSGSDRRRKGRTGARAGRVLQDGLRLYLAGNPDAPVPRRGGRTSTPRTPVRSGINYRSALLRSRDDAHATTSRPPRCGGRPTGERCGCGWSAPATSPATTPSPCTAWTWPSRPGRGPHRGRRAVAASAPTPRTTSCCVRNTPATTPSAAARSGGRSSRACGGS